MRQIISLAGLAGLAGLLAACGSETAPDTPQVARVVSIELTPNAVSIVEKGATAQLSAVVKTDGGTSTAAVTWSSGAPTIASVSGAGTSATVTPLAPGTAIVTATAGGITGQAVITVTSSPKRLTVTRVGDGAIASNPAGLTCSGTTCSAEFPDGASVALTATPAQGSRLSEWTGACTGAGPCTLAMTADRNVTVTFEAKVQANGLTPEINAFLSDSLLAVMTSIGITINRGATPPSIEGTYRASPTVLRASNVPSDVVGMSGPTIFERLRHQDNEHLTIVSDYVAGLETGSGIAAFIVGTDSSFTVFGRFKTVLLGDTADNLEVISGQIRSDGIANAASVLLMLDNRGNPHGIYIPNNTGRLWADADGFSERTADLDSLGVSSGREAATAFPPSHVSDARVPSILGLLLRRSP